MDDKTSSGPPPSGPEPSGADFKAEDHVLDGNTWWTRDRAHWWDGRKWRSARETPPNPHVSAGGAITPPPPPPPPIAPPPPPAPPVYTEPARPIVEITVSAGTAFKIGFYGAIGWVIATAVFWILLIVIFGSCLAAARP